MTKELVPSFDMIIEPALQALHNLGGSASNQEMEDEIVQIMELSPEIAEFPHGAGGSTEVGYRAGWARTYLKHAGLIQNSAHGIWSLTPTGKQSTRIDSKAIVREVRKGLREQKDLRNAERAIDDPQEEGWTERLLRVLLDMDPIAFERLCQRLLRESGFLDVEVTKRSGDGGIDGYGTLRIGGMISFNVLFQSKRYQGNLGPSTVRDFRGAMVGRTDKGLIITTGGFTRDARREASRDGAPAIDLIDGEQLVQKLKDLRLGVSVKKVEEVTIQEAWFAEI